MLHFPKDCVVLRNTFEIMGPVYWIDIFSISVLFGLTVLVAFGGIMLGQFFGSRMKALTSNKDSIGSVVGATLGFLAFLLAFTFNMAANRFDNRKNLMVDELNAIETTYRRAGLLSEPKSAEVRALLKEYVGLRVSIAEDPTMIAHAILRSSEIQEKLWNDVENLSKEEQLSIKHSLYIQSLNQLMDLHEKRIVVGLHFRIPSPIWTGLYILAILSMIVVGYQFGQSKHRQILVSVILALAFSSVIALIADLDRSASGSITVNQQPLFEFHQKLQNYAE